MNKQETNIIKAEGKDLIGGKMVIKANNYKKYKATFDYSLVAEELAEDGAEFYEVNGKQFTNDIINVSFKYAETYNDLQLKALKNYINNLKYIEHIELKIQAIKKANKILKKEELKSIKQGDKDNRKQIKEKYETKNKTEIKKLKYEFKLKYKKIYDSLIPCNTNSLFYCVILL